MASVCVAQDGPGKIVPNPSSSQAVTPKLQRQRKRKLLQVMMLLEVGVLEMKVVVEAVVQVVAVQEGELHKSLASEASEERRVKKTQMKIRTRPAMKMEEQMTMQLRKMQLELTTTTQLPQQQLLLQEAQEVVQVLILVPYVVLGALAMDMELATQRQESVSVNQVGTITTAMRITAQAGKGWRSATVMVYAP